MSVKPGDISESTTVSRASLLQLKMNKNKQGKEKCL